MLYWVLDSDPAETGQELTGQPDSQAEPDNRTDFDPDKVCNRTFR